MRGHIELYEAVIRRSATSVLHAPLFRVDGGPLRRVSDGKPETGVIHSMEPMSEWRQAQVMSAARLVARL